ncbi:hypothetical protein JCM14036_21770 [Desulfotomaculum defluvii]
MKKVLLLVSLVIVSTLYFVSGCQNAPFKKPLQENQVIYRHDQYLVTANDNQITVTAGLSNKVFTTKDNSFSGTSRIKNKQKEALPLKGTYIKDGLLIKGQNNSYLLSLTPEIKLLASYPNPRTKDKLIIINKQTNSLYYFDQGSLVKKYPVATGKKEYYTPEGSFKIVNKMHIKEGNHPDDLYGPRWLGLAVSDVKDKRANDDERAPSGHKYGIHGTNEPDSIGTHASGGCIRLSNHDILELYKLVPVGTKVLIE